ncbi:MAG TPA: hypothetical protein DDW90_11190 [Cyanobacteria bacterium UBA9971]|nr:hypothetical protein [Cyanobacteria bacterium UBA9971]
MNIVIILLLLTIIVETAQQLFFKMAGMDNKKRLIYSFLGISMYLLFVVIWLRILKDLPLGFALPIMGFNYVTVAFAGNLFFKEKISIKRWGGIMLILLGLTLVWFGGASFL